MYTCMHVNVYQVRTWTVVYVHRHTALVILAKIENWKHTVRQTFKYSSHSQLWLTISADSRLKEGRPFWSWSTAHHDCRSATTLQRIDISYVTLLDYGKNTGWWLTSSLIHEGLSGLCRELGSDEDENKSICPSVDRRTLPSTSTSSVTSLPWCFINSRPTSNKSRIWCLSNRCTYRNHW